MKTFYHIILVSFLSISLWAQSSTYTVQKGDTLYSLSRKYKISIEELRSLNNMGMSNNLFVGQKLILPDTGTQKEDLNSTKKIANLSDYTVQAGDTLYGIARKHNMTVKELQELNSLTDSSILKVGQVLSITTRAQNTIAQKQDTNATTSLPIINDIRNYSTKKGNINLVWPVKAKEVLYVSGKISGVALTGTKDENVTAIRSGVCMFSGVYRGFGQVVFVQAKNGYIYVYTGLSSLAVAKGDTISYKQKLGTIGNDPLSEKNIINLMVFNKGNPVDPAKAPRG